MTTEYTYRATIAAPESMIDSANQLALCLGQSAADDQTFRVANYQDSQGNKYAVASTVAKPNFATGAQSQLVAPEFAPDVDLTAASLMQSRLSIGSLESPVTATPSGMAAILGSRLESAQDHLAALGLEPVPLEEPQA
jgi:hypothetical protein